MEDVIDRHNKIWPYDTFQYKSCVFINVYFL